MAVVDLTAEEFEQKANSPGILLVDFWADWCRPCRMFAPIYEQASETHPGITFGKIDTEAEPDLAAIARISSIPTLVVFRDGTLVYRRSGPHSGRALEKLITKVQGLDMVAVRAKAATRRP